LIRRFCIFDELRVGMSVSGKGRRKKETAGGKSPAVRSLDTELRLEGVAGAHLEDAGVLLNSLQVRPV